MLIRSVTLTLLIGITVAVKAQRQWTLEKESDGVKVYLKEVPGYQLKAFKALVYIAAPLDSVYGYLLKFEERTKWIYGTSEAKLLHKVEGKEYIMYSVYDAPWPVTDRDMVIKFLTGPPERPEERLIQYTAVPHYVPVKKDLVRIEKSQGSWSLRQEGQAVEVIFEGFTSNAGSLPDWVVNQVVVVNPYESLRNLRRKLQPEK
jgi:hypothetical protein